MVCRIWFPNGGSRLPVEQGLTRLPVEQGLKQGKEEVKKRQN